MRKANNFIFVILLIIGVLILFTYCQSVKALDSDVLPNDVGVYRDEQVDPYSGPANPNIEYSQPSPRPNLFNTNLIYPYTFKEFFPSSGTQYINLFGGLLTYEDFNINFNSDRMYYKPVNILNNLPVMECYSIVFLKDYYENLHQTEPLVVDVELNDKFGNSFVVKGEVFFPTYQYYYGNTIDYYTGNGNNKLSTDIGDGNFSTYFILRYYPPIYAYFESVLQNNGFNGYYLSDIILPSTFPIDFNTTSKQESFIYTFATKCVYNNVLLPSKNDVIVCYTNNLWNDDVTGLIIDDYNTALYLNCTVDNNKVSYYTEQVGVENEYVYSSINSKNNNVRLNTSILFRKEFYTFEYKYPDFGSFLDFFDDADTLKLVFESMDIDITNLTFERCRVRRSDNVPGGNWYSRYYTPSCYMALMPRGEFTAGSSLQFTDINAEKYYIEPNDWKDFGAYANNIIVWICFEMPLLSTVTKPLYLFLNGFLKIWTEIALPLASAMGLVGGALIFYVIYAFISKLLFNKEPD